MFKHKTNKKEKNWRSAKSNDCKKVLNFSYCCLPNSSLLNLSKNKNMISKNIPLKASTIENQRPVFVSCPDWYKEWWNSNMRHVFDLLLKQFRNLFQKIIWKKSFVVCWQVFLICFDVWLNVWMYCCALRRCMWVRGLYSMLYISKEIWLTALLSVIHKTAHWASKKPFYCSQFYEHSFGSQFTFLECNTKYISNKPDYLKNFISCCYNCHL